MLDKLTSIKVVKAVSELHSFSAAARRMGMSHTMVCKHVGFLEEELKTRLFHRSTRQVRATPECKKYLQLMHGVLEEMQRIEEAVLLDRGKLTGTLRLQAPEVLVRSFLMNALTEYRARHPGMRIDIAVCRITDTVLSDEVDLLIQLGPGSTPLAHNEQLIPTRGVVCAAPSYLAERGIPSGIVDLTQHTCIRCTPNASDSQDKWLFGADGDIPVTVSGDFWTNDWEVIRLAALDGYGLAYVPTFLVEEDLAEGRLMELPLDVPMGEYLPICASYRSGDSLSARTRAFLDVLRDGCARQCKGQISKAPELRLAAAN